MTRQLLVAACGLLRFKKRKRYSVLRRLCFLLPYKEVCHLTHQVPTGGCSALRDRDPPGPPRVTSASVVTVTPLASTPTPTPAVVAIISVGSDLTAKTNTKLTTHTFLFVFRCWSVLLEHRHYRTCGSLRTHLHNTYRERLRVAPSETYCIKPKNVNFFSTLKNITKSTLRYFWLNLADIRQLYSIDTCHYNLTSIATSDTRVQWANRKKLSKRPNLERVWFHETNTCVSDSQ